LRRPTTPPSISSASLTDSDDGDGLVNGGDSVTITATVSDATTGVASVTADASALDAGTVTLTDENGDGTYERTVSVGSNPTEGDQTVTITATDGADNTASATTGSLEVDTTAPNIETFEIEDTSEYNFIILYWEYVEEFQVRWSVTSPDLNSASVEIIRDGTIQESYSGPIGDEQYQEVRAYQTGGREHTIRITATDAAGNSVCQQVVDVADGTDPADSDYESCG
jgi:hypothetical protein